MWIPSGGDAATTSATMATEGAPSEGPGALSVSAPAPGRPTPVDAEAALVPDVGSASIIGVQPPPALEGASFDEVRPLPLLGPNRAGPPAAGAAPVVPSKARRTVRVSDFDRLMKQVEHMSIEAAKTAVHVEAIQEELHRSRRSRLGLDVLHAVARQDQYPCGRALQRVLGQRLLKRLKATPARPSARGHGVQGRAAQEQVAISFDVPFTRTGIDELVSTKALTYTRREGRRPARPVRTVHFSGAVALLRALDLLGSVDP